VFLLALFIYYNRNTPELDYYIRVVNDIYSENQSLIYKDRNGTTQSLIQAENFIRVDSFNQRHIAWLIQFENKSFYYDVGFNPVSLIYSSYLNLIGKSHRGGSTITMQLARIVSQKRENSVDRKMAEIMLSFKIFCAISKKSTLSCYLNLSPVAGLTGFPNAARKYFDKDCKDLSDSEFLILLATLPGKSDASNRYERYARVLLDTKKITEWEYFNLLMEKPVLSATTMKVVYSNMFSPIFSHVVRENMYQITKDTLNLYISFLLQDTLEKTIQHYIGKLPDSRVVASFALVQADDMSVLCYCNSNSVRSLQYDLIASPYSLPYSRIKPLIYSLLINKTDVRPDEIWLPTNYSYSKRNFSVNKKFTCNLTEALSHSRNSPAIYTLNEEITLKNFKSVLTDNGLIPDSILIFPSAALGAFNISELNLLNVMRVSLYNGKVLLPKFTKSRINNSEHPPVIDSAKCQSIREILLEAIDSGTSRNLKGLDSMNITVYNKTGSSDRGDAVGCAGLLKINNKFYLYTLRLESPKRIFTFASIYAVPLLKQICEVISIHSFLLD
jgi:penicillin-binding protein 1C